MHARVQQSTRAPTVARLEPLMVVMVEDERHDDADAFACRPVTVDDSLDSTRAHEMTITSIGIHRLVPCLPFAVLPAGCTSVAV